MERKLSKQLEEWYNNPNRKPLFLDGARRVGKTYLVKEIFLKEKFSSYVYINLSKDDEACDFFNSTCDPEKYLIYIESSYKKKITKDVPLVIDDIQNCPVFFASLKSFCQDYRELPIIIIGSHVQTVIKKYLKQYDAIQFPYPQDYIDTLTLYSLTFEEYLINTNPELLSIIKEAYSKKEPLEEEYDRQANKVLNEYIKIGGLPEVLNTFLSRNSIKYLDDAKEVLSSIYEMYINDFAHYNITYPTMIKTKTVFDNIYKQLIHCEKNFKIQSIDSEKSNRDYTLAYDRLISSHEILLCKNTKGKLTNPFTAGTKSLFRLYFSDIGLLSHQYHHYITAHRYYDSTPFYDTIFTSELVTRNIPLYFWTAVGRDELDFVVNSNNKLYGITTHDYSYESTKLGHFRKYNPDSYYLCLNDNKYIYNKDEKIFYLPYYEAFLLAEDLAQGNDIF